MNKPLIAALSAGVLVATACGGGGGATTTPASTPTPTPATTSVVSHGTITGFGSVIIDGVRYDTSRAAFSVDGSSGRSQDDLSVGQRVTVRGSIRDDGSRSAGEVEYEAELHGIVSTIDLANSRFVALGQTIVTDASTIFSGIADLSGLAANDHVEVSGNRAADGSILATYVEKESARGELEVKGSVSALDTTQKHFSIGNQRVDYSGATLAPGLTLANGSFVEVKGVVRSEVLVATRVGREDDLRSDDRGDLAEIEGVVRELASDSSSFLIGPTRVTVSAATTYEDGTAATLVNGVKLEAKGIVQADGSLAASKIEFKQRGRDRNGSDDDNDGTFGRDAKIEATITAINSAARSFTVLGITVTADDTTVYRDSRDRVRTFGFAQLTVGDFVELGLIETNGVLTASKVERDDSDSTVFVQAGVDSFNATSKTLVIAGVSIDASSARYQIDEATVSAETFYAQVSVGAKVKAKGSYNGTTLLASEVELDRED